MKIDNKYEFEEEVYLKTDPDQYPRMVTGIMVRPKGVIEYELTCGTDVSCHSDYEMTKDKKY